MTMKTYNIKLTCFFCKYEINKSNKSKNCVKFKGNVKHICRFCTKRKHKPLEIVYRDIDTQCKVCKKSVMFKNCIACKICDHFYHGRCLNLTTQDIIKIETINNSYMCFECNYECLPQYIETKRIKNKNAIKSSTASECFTCCNKITKDKYINKFLIYDNKKRCLCRKCGKLGKDIPVRKKSLIEFLDCSLCEQQVKYESIYCNLCQHWVHPYCNNVNRDELKKLSETDEYWYCLKCNLSIYPNNLILDDVSPSSRDTRNITTHQYKTYDDCSVCLKKVTGKETLACASCYHWVHKKCIGKFNDRSDYQNFLHYYSSKPWDCPICVSTMLPFVLMDNDEFYMLLLDMNTAPMYCNKEKFLQICTKLKDVDFFDDLDNDTEQNKYLNNIDPDINYPIKDTCTYTIDTENITVQSCKELSMMTFNIRSIKRNFDNFVNFLCKLKCKIHIICLTESWLGPLDNIDDFELNGYQTPIFQNRLGNFHGGGVITYIHRDIEKHRYVKNMSFVDEYNHCLATEITVNNKASTFLNIYRSPNNLNNCFLDKFEPVIDIAKSKICYVLGDMNYNLINHDKHAHTKIYYNILTASSFKPLITKPTRISDTGQTLIDHIWTNDLRDTTINKSHIVITDITDHLPCINFITSPDVFLKGYRTISSRKINDENRTAFSKTVLEKKDILAFYTNNRYESSLEKKYDDYFFHLSRIYNDCFPLIQKKVHVKTLSKPWMTPEVIELINKKNDIFKTKKKNNTAKNKKKYKSARIKMEEAIDKEKTSYYAKLMENTNNNIQQKWKAIRVIINRKKTEQNTCPIPSSILGQHYASVAKKLSEKLPKLDKGDIPCTSTNTTKRSCRLKKQTFSFNETTQREVYETILKLDPSKGPGVDNLDVKSLKSIADVISSHLAPLFNQSMQQGIYPQCLKVAQCVPVYKGSPLDPLSPSNYRPISILTAINKTFERILHGQLVNYLEENKLLPSCQYGYRKQHNTSQAVIDLMDHVNKSLDEKMITIAIFMDLSKAFDTVDRTILLNKLHELGLADTSTSLINSYMTNRTFCMADEKELKYELSCGVPQGSILGPLLFIMYIYDMTEITKENKIIVYADDTTVLVKGRNLIETKQHCNDIISRFYNYFTLNKLSINLSKTKYMVFKPRFHGKKRKRLFDTSGLSIKMDDIELEQVSSLRFLGVILNDKLTWDNHKQYIYNKVCRSLGILYKCKYAMREVETIKMYKAFIQPYFLYAIEIWGHTVHSDNDILNKLQSKIIRILFNCKRSADAWRHNNAQITSIKQLYYNAIRTLCFKHHLGLLPQKFSEAMPHFNCIQLQNRITRVSLEQMYNYKNDLTSAKTPFYENCIKIWNALSFDLKTLPCGGGKGACFKALKSLKK